MPALRLGRWIAVLAFVGSNQLAAEETALKADLAEIMRTFEVCLDSAKDRAAVVGNEALRPSFFDAKADACTRIRDANISSAYATAGISATQGERAAIEAEMAALTDALLANARADLGLSEAN